ncbi:hypothetical protein AGMMS49959_08170 [Planctomycetales bacterium]|nr:hypothetical protein AGMMS49959_08170 [Planctomycetales bacterium]
MDWLMENWKLLSSPVICAFIGWLTNYLAVKMLFRPRRPVNLLGLKVQGVFPRRQKALAENLGRMIEKNLINHDDLRRALNTPEFQQVFRDAVIAKIGGFLDKLVGENPMLAIFINEQVRTKVGELLLAEVAGIIPEILATAADKLREYLNFSELVRDKVEKFDSERIEELLLDVMRKEFGFIEFVGGALGFVIGLVQAAIFYF